MRSVNFGFLIKPELCANIMAKPIGVKRREVAGGAPGGPLNNASFVGCFFLKHLLSPALCLRQFGAQGAVAVRRARNSADIIIQSRELFGRKRMDSAEEDGQAGTTLSL